MGYAYRRYRRCIGDKREVGMMERNPNRDALVQQIIEIGGFLVIMYLAKKMARPDFGRTLQMRGALTVKRIACVQVDIWQRIADNAATAYNKARV